MYRPGRWEIKIMKMTDYPYHDFQGMKWAKDTSLGESIHPNNPFLWEKIVRNLTHIEE